MKKIIYLTVFASLFSCSSNQPSSDVQTETSIRQEDMAAPDPLDTTGGKGVFFVDLKDSQDVKSPLLVKMGVKGMDVEAAGPVNNLKGHHHIIIDGAAIAEGAGVPLDETNLHFGKGQTESELKLTKGFHTLTLQFANGVHGSYGPRWSRTITVNAK